MNTITELSTHLGITQGEFVAVCAIAILVSINITLIGYWSLKDWIENRRARRRRVARGRLK